MQPAVAVRQPESRVDTPMPAEYNTGRSPGGPREGEVSELVDEHDLGSCAERRGSSTLPFPTMTYRIHNSPVQGDLCGVRSPYGRILRRRY